MRRVGGVQKWARAPSRAATATAAPAQSTAPRRRCAPGPGSHGSPGDPPDRPARGGIPRAARAHHRQRHAPAA